MGTSIFISYRRVDSSDVTGRIYDRLVATFDRNLVFKDVDSIPFGVDFREHLDQAVSHCQVCLAVIGRTWLEVSDQEGRRRIDSSQDFVRLELESALRRNIPVIPVLVSGARMPAPDQLPFSLQSLAYHHAAQVRSDPDFHRDMDRLIVGIQQHLGIAQPPSPQPLQPMKAQQVWRRVVPEINPKMFIPVLQKPAQRKQPFTFEVVTVNDKGQEIDRKPGQAEYRTEDLGNGITLGRVAIPGGTFEMGSKEEENEQPIHRVTVAPFWMGKFPVTQEQYEAVMGTNPSKFKGAKRPVEQVPWPDAALFCQRLSEKLGNQYRLPSEAEWEYVCRAGTKTPFYFGETITTALANYRGTDWEYDGKTYPGNYGKGPRGQFREQTTPVGKFPANGLGLYDMHGNVWEWCADHWHKSYQGAPSNGSAWTDKNNDFRLLRGGSWHFNPRHCRSASRYYSNARVENFNIGFRVVCDSPRTL
jgi:formylglycine-generating enzyme required for sulfatase activity